MEKQAFIDQLKALTTQENVLAVSRDVNELQSKFEDFLLEEGRLRQVAQLEAQERGETPEEDPAVDALKDEFYALYSDYKERKKAIIDEKNATQSENLKKKRALIAKLRAVVEEEENIGQAFGAYKEIQEAWKQVGEIPRDKRPDIQGEYSRLLEEFFYNMKIYREIKEYDFKKNLEAKEAIIERIKELTSIESIKEVETSLKALQNEWEDVGPAPQEEWERVKEAYWSNVKATWDRIQAFYDERKLKMQENLDQKKALLEEARTLVAQKNESVKDWDVNTKALLALQEKWKTIGFGPKKENEEVWKLFRTECDTFFEAKSNFFEGIREVYDKIADRKKGLIAKVEALKTSTDWKETTQQIINIQKEWKKAGNAGQRNEQTLWKEFRAACDYFFDAKQKHFDELDKLNSTNLSAKEELIKEIESFQLPATKKEAIDALKAFSQKFAQIGKVPFKDKDRVYKAYKSALDAHYAQLKLEGQERDKVMFEAKIDTIAGSADAKKMFGKEKQEIRNQINEIKQEIIQYENNLGFFANSKGANALKQEVERKIESSNEKIAALKQRLKMIPQD